MEFSTLSVTRPNNPPLVLWGKAPKLIVVVALTRYNTADFLLAYGIDPQHVDPEHDTPVFERLLPVDGLGEFLRTLVGGEPGMLAADEVDPVMTMLQEQLGGEIIANSVDVTNTQPPPPGPKLSVLFTYTTSITKVESMAESGGTEPVQFA